jgi:hypothetical protein
MVPDINSGEISFLRDVDELLILPGLKRNGIGPSSSRCNKFLQLKTAEWFLMHFVCRPHG